MQRILDVIDAAVGPCSVVADLSWPHGESTVLDLATADGRRLIAKAHRRADKYHAERAAYETWVPSLGDRAPALLAADDSRRVLVVSRLDADHLSDEQLADPEVSRQAGELLRRLHQSRPGVPMGDYAERQRARVESWVGRARPGLFGVEEVEFVRSQIDVFDAQPAPIGVPCHRDWQPRNWLIDRAGRLSVIDFEHARVGPWHDDLHRLWWDEWRGRPALAGAFFDGYGRQMTAAEHDALLAASTIGHLCTVVWSDEHGDTEFGDFGRHSLQAAMSGAAPGFDRQAAATNDPPA